MIGQVEVEVAFLQDVQADGALWRASQKSGVTLPYIVAEEV